MKSWNPAVLAINGYQRYISPHKGFCCAHRVLTGEASCSEYVKQAIMQKGLLGSWSDITRRFATCKESARYLNETKAKEKEQATEKKESKSSSSDAACIAADTLACIPTSCADISLGSVAGSAGTLASGGCDGCACTPF
ncbi:MAG: membrane protein insertion efficiency factor YidD [Candidatus Thiodiazotropha sp.]